MEINKIKIYGKKNGPYLFLKSLLYNGILIEIIEWNEDRGQSSLPIIVKIEFGSLKIFRGQLIKIQNHYSIPFGTKAIVLSIDFPWLKNSSDILRVTCEGYSLPFSLKFSNVIWSP